MRTTSNLFGLSLVATLAIACGGKPAPEQPAPQPAPQPTQPVAQPAPTTPADDSEARERARREAEERARREAADARAKAMGALSDQLVAVVHFDFDKADILSEDEANLSRKAVILAANSAVRLRISGHADERGSDEYNLALGNRRAAAAKRYLVNKGIETGRLDVISYGEERPADPGHDEAAWARNRRDEFEILPSGTNLVAPQ